MFDNGSGGACMTLMVRAMICEWYPANNCPNYGDNYVNFGYNGAELCCACGWWNIRDGGGG